MMEEAKKEHLRFSWMLEWFDGLVLQLACDVCGHSYRVLSLTDLPT